MATAGPRAGTRPARMAASADRARRLDDGLGPFDEQQHGLADLLLVDRHHLVDVGLDVGEGQLAAGAHGDAVRHGGQPLQCHGPAGPERSRVGAPWASTADDPGAGPRPRQPGAGTHPDGVVAGVRAAPTPGDQAAPADGHDDHLGLGRFLGQLQADGALAGDDLRVVERRHVHRPGRDGEGLGQRDAVVDHLTFEPDLGPVAPGGVHLGQGRPHAA